MRILLVEDDRDVSELIQRGLQESRYQVVAAYDGENGLKLALEGGFALIILDLMLPRLDGWQLCTALRERKINTPILMLTARDALQDRVKGLELGADDYLVKPFEFAELLARVHAAIRRDRVHRGRRIKVADLEIDTGSGVVTREGRRIELTQRELELLEALASHEGRVVTRDYILDHLWYDETPFSNAIDVHIKNLRRKIDSGYQVKLIHSVYGQGYTMEARSAPDRTAEDES